MLTKNSHCAMIKHTIEVHFAKSIPQYSLRAAKPREKGTGAEVCAVAGALLAVRRRSVLLSQKCGVLSSIQRLYCFVVLEIAVWLSFFVSQKGKFV